MQLVSFFVHVAMWLTLLSPLIAKTGGLRKGEAAQNIEDNT